MGWASSEIIIKPKSLTFAYSSKCGRVYWKPDWVFCGPCEIGDLPWKSEVLSQGRRDSRNQKGAGLKVLRVRQDQQPRRPPCLPFFTDLSPLSPAHPLFSTLRPVYTPHHWVL